MGKWFSAILLCSTLSVLAQTDQQRLVPPETGTIAVAFLISRGANVMDTAGAWEVFQDVTLSGSVRHPFKLYTVAESKDPVVLSGGLKVVPDHDFGDAPQPNVIVIPAQSTNTAMLEWVRKAAAGADMTLSVCTGAFVLARAGLLEGRAATTHHDSLDRLADQFPNTDVKRDVRYVEGPRITTAAGLTSGIDASLRIVERYYGREVAEATASYMEHESTAWRERRGHWDDSVWEDKGLIEPVYPPVLSGNDPIHLANGKTVAGRAELMAEYDGYRYLFAEQATRAEFLKDPAGHGIQFGGACGSMAKRGALPKSGDSARWYVHDKKLYIFASDQCRESFKKDPASFAAE